MCCFALHLNHVFQSIAPFLFSRGLETRAVLFKLIPSDAKCTYHAGLLSDPQRNARVLSLEERKALEEEQKHQRQQRMEESNTRKKAMNELELTRKQHEKPSDLEQVNSNGTRQDNNGHHNLFLVRIFIELPGINLGDLITKWAWAVKRYMYNR